MREPNRIILPALVAALFLALGCGGGHARDGDVAVDFIEDEDGADDAVEVPAEPEPERPDGPEEADGPADGEEEGPDGGCADACAWGQACVSGECLYPESITLTILDDTYIFDERLSASGGFSCWVTGLDAAILLDTGFDAVTLLSNMDILGVNAADAGYAMLSHDHTDHTAGLRAFLARRSGIPVFLPASFREAAVTAISDAGATPVLVSDPQALTDGAWSTGEMGVEIKEHGLLLATAEGPVLVTGCAHPGIVSIVEGAMEVSGAAELFLVAGGFHLRDMTEDQIRPIIEQLQALGVRKVAPTHCTGDLAIGMFEAAYGADFIRLGAGQVVTLP